MRQLSIITQVQRSRRLTFGFLDGVWAGDPGSLSLIDAALSPSVLTAGAVRLPFDVDGEVDRDGVDGEARLDGDWIDSFFEPSACFPFAGVEGALAIARVFGFDFEPSADTLYVRSVKN